MKILKKIGISLVILLLILAVFITYHMQTHAIVTTKEMIPAGEAAQIKIAAKQAESIVEGLKTTYAARGVHAKGHACVKAYVDVNPDIAPQLQYGVFAKPNTRYKSWIRFSNSGSNMANADDRAKDARGMAIKLLNVGSNSNGGTHINGSTNLNGGHTQEFIAHNSPAFFVTSVKDYNQFVATKGDPAYFIQGYNPFKWRLRELWQLVTAFAPPPKSPLWTQYFSNTAYKLGPNNIKFMMQSCEAHKHLVAGKTDDADFLKHTLSAELASGDACMQLMVQVQDTHNNMPIEDATVLWQERDSPFLPVATITILKQQFTSPQQQQFCENLAFSPWNALAEHQPIGALNRARKWVYEASSNYRHHANKTTVPQNLDW